MKISKSKQELARIISENGGWRDGEFAAQDGDGGVGGYEVKPEWDSPTKYWWREALGEWFLANKIKNHHQTVLSRAEYFHLYPAPDADGWIEWSGSECPVEAGTIVDVKHRDGDIGIRCHAGLSSSEPDGGGHATAKDWSHLNEGGDIIAYRQHKPDQSGAADKLSSEAVSVEKIALMSDSIEELVRKPTIEQLAADYRKAKDYAERKQQEADEAKADADARLKTLEIAGEAIWLTVSPITEKQEPELVITDWRGLRIGDEVEARCHAGVLIGFITEMEPKDYDGERPFRFQPPGESTRWCTSSKFKFIRRP